jgi:elongation factor G
MTRNCKTMPASLRKNSRTLFTLQGKTQVPVNELHAGDIGAVAKLRDTLTGDTLGDKGAPIQYPRVKLPEPAITFAIEPKTRADEDKLGQECIS